ncbi:MAG: response regulator, partial [Candidatus Omnitrophica bacterium]|nr:response regulator [Candidatus Omnitrophota bacterium]
MANLVLVIDDDPDVWTTLAIRFKSFGYTMVSAEDGAGGFEKARMLNPKLILLDFGLPYENGLQILKKLKADKKTQDITVIMLT